MAKESKNDEISRKDIFVQKFLDDDETILMQTTTRWTYMLPWIIFAVACVVLGFVSINMAVANALGLLIWFLILAAIFILLPYAMVKMTVLAYTEKRLIGRTGIMRKSKVNARLDEVTKVSLRQGSFAKRLGFGNLSISAHKVRHEFSGMANAEEFKDGLMRQIDLFEEEQEELEERQRIETEKQEDLEQPEVTEQMEEGESPEEVQSQEQQDSEEE